MAYSVLGFPEDGPTISLDWEQFSYAGKFEMSATGKAVLEDEEVLAAAAFNADREQPDRAWIRYLTVREDRQGEGLGTRLARLVTGTLLENGYERVRIGVNNPIAYRALYKAGFYFTGRETGIAELILDYPGPRDPPSYRAGLSRFAERDLPEPHAERVEAWLEDGTPPSVLSDIPLPTPGERSDDGAG
ncbi:MAG: GNAT family N-acetyltransferase [Halodesulfurarchaeum sp.]